MDFVRHEINPTMLGICLATKTLSRVDYGTEVYSLSRLVPDLNMLLMQLHEPLTVNFPVS